MVNRAAVRETIRMTTTLELPPPGAATYADLEALPERFIGELIEGTLYAQARPASRHARAASALGSRLFAGFDGTGGVEGGPPGGWWILFEPELHFAADVLVPDIAGWRREQMPAMQAQPWFTEVPDWVCEVLSPGAAERDRTLKLTRYHERGVGHVWLVNPEARHVEAFAHTEAGWLLVGNYFDDAVVSLPPFQALPIGLGELWLG
jgi:Uma2 family endonuclease